MSSGAAPAAGLFLHRMIFIRHGETTWNVEGRLQGRLDTTLNGRGRQQAAAAARGLKTWLGPQATTMLADLPFYASPLSRTRETMDIVRTVVDLPDKAFTTDDRLRELSFGTWQGQTWNDVKTKSPGAYKTRRADRWNFVPPEGESYAMGACRVREWLLTLPASDVLVVAHGGVARTLMVLLGGIATADAADAPIPQGRVMLLEGGALRWVGD